MTARRAFFVRLRQSTRPPGASTTERLSSRASRVRSSGINRLTNRSPHSHQRPRSSSTSSDRNSSPTVITAGGSCLGDHLSAAALTSVTKSRAPSLCSSRQTKHQRYRLWCQFSRKPANARAWHAVQFHSEQPFGAPSELAEGIAGGSLSSGWLQYSWPSPAHAHRQLPTRRSERRDSPRSPQRRTQRLY